MDNIAPTSPVYGQKLTPSQLDAMARRSLLPFRYGSSSIRLGDIGVIAAMAEAISCNLTAPSFARGDTYIDNDEGARETLEIERRIRALYDAYPETDAILHAIASLARDL